MKRRNGLIAAGTVLSLVATLDMLLSPESVSLIDLVLRMSYVGTSFEFPSLFNMTFRLFPLFAFQAIMGNSYYDYFCTGSVYYFSRCQLRKKWLAKKQFELLLASILEASNPVPTPLLGHRCRSSQEITGSPTPFSTSNHYLWICPRASFSLSNPNIAA